MPCRRSIPKNSAPSPSTWSAGCASTRSRPIGPAAACAINCWASRQGLRRGHQRPARRSPPGVRTAAHGGHGRGVRRIRVVGPRSAGQVEVATFRQDATYSDGRHPDSVQFSTPPSRRRAPRLHDQRHVLRSAGRPRDRLCRRAATIWRDSVIRAIGDPRARFAEDKLRMLRAVRFRRRVRFHARSGDARRPRGDGARK